MVRTFFDKGEDYIDSFWPFILKVLPKDRSFAPIEAIQGEIKDKYGLDIPQYSLSVILTRAKRKNYVVQSKGKCALTESGLTYLNTFETERDVERRTNELLEDARLYLNQKYNLSFSVEEARELIDAFIKEHIEMFEQFINPERETTDICIQNNKTLKTYESALLTYFSDVEQKKPSIFETLKDIICGSVISSIINSKELSEVTKKFDRTTVYFDTNFAFSVLGLHYEEYNVPALELFNLMRTEGVFEFKIFDFTIDEMVSVLKNYFSEGQFYLPNIKVGSVFSSLKSKRWTDADMKEFIVKIEETLWGKGIKIEPTGVDLQVYSPQKEEYRTSLKKYKVWQNTKSQNHDLAAIERIAILRKNPVRRIETAKAFFLTSDMRLSKYDFCERGHRDRETLCEVIPDRLLTNILWLKHPNAVRELSITSIISMHSRHLFIDREVWTKFFRTINDLRKRGSIDERDISILIYDRHIQDILKTYNPEEASEIGEGWILKEMEAVKKRVDEETKHEIEELRKEFEQKAIETRRETSRETDEKWLGKIKEIKRGLENDAEKQSKYICVGAGIIVFGLLIILSILTVPVVLKRWQTIEPVSWIVSILLAALVYLFGIKINPGGIRARLKGWLFNYVYRRKLRKSKLHDLVK
jgi:hypothetical protein